MPDTNGFQRPSSSEVLRHALEYIFNDAQRAEDFSELKIETLSKEGVTHSGRCENLKFRARDGSVDAKNMTLVELRELEAAGNVCGLCATRYQTHESRGRPGVKLEYLLDRRGLLEEFEEEANSKAPVPDNFKDMITRGQYLDSLEEHVIGFQEEWHACESDCAYRIEMLIEDKRSEFRAAALAPSFRQSLIDHAVELMVSSEMHRKAISFPEVADSPARNRIVKRYEKDMRAYWSSRSEYVISKADGRGTRPYGAWNSASDMMTLAWPVVDGFSVVPYVIYETFVSFDGIEAALLKEAPTTGVIEVIKTLHHDDGMLFNEACAAAAAV